MEPAIKVRGLGKRYYIGALRNESGTLYESLLKRFRHRRKNANPLEDEVWALKDIDLEVMPGEVVGVIGRNGAGKSTLLKILSRITEPTEGTAEIRGRLGSLLEVGTGFHADLTGRENIYLNAAIIGMTRAETKAKFDEIVAFSGVERFIDTPIRHYSSGMRVRLGFAVAAHLETEILLVDEALAVGDLEFQKKCLNKMKDVATHGRTVLFVSHNNAAIEKLTTRCIILEAGKLTKDADTQASMTAYLQTYAGGTTSSLAHYRTQASEQLNFVKFEMFGADGAPQKVFRPLDPIRLVIGVEYKEPLQADIGIQILTNADVVLFCSFVSDSQALRKESGYVEYTVSISPNYLVRASYFISLVSARPGKAGYYDVIESMPAFEIDGHPEVDGYPIGIRSGSFHFPFQWNSSRISLKKAA